MMYKKFLQGLLFASMGFILVCQDASGSTRLECVTNAEKLADDCFKSHPESDEIALNECLDQMESDFHNCMKNRLCLTEWRACRTNWLAENRPESIGKGGTEEFLLPRDIQKTCDEEHTQCLREGGIDK